MNKWTNIDKKTSGVHFRFRVEFNDFFPMGQLTISRFMASRIADDKSMMTSSNINNFWDAGPLSLVDSPHKGQWRGTLIFSLICAWTNGWMNNRDAGDLRRHRVHYDVTVMVCETNSGAFHQFLTFAFDCNIVISSFRMREIRLWLRLVLMAVLQAIMTQGRQ